MKICPICGSESVSCVSLSDESLWICKTCSYTGSVIEGDEKLIKKVREEYNYKLKKEKINETEKENEPFLENLMKICPNCGSDNVNWVLPQLWSIWNCETCGYRGPVIEGDEKLIREIRKGYIEKLKEEKKEINELEQENESLEEDLTDEEIEKKLDELLESDLVLDNYEKLREEIISKTDTTIAEIYKSLEKEILSWNDKIKFKTVNDNLTFSYNSEFLKISLDNDKINLKLSFSENKPFDDYKAITQVKSENEKIKIVFFSLNSYDDIDYALFLIEQSYENNNKNNYLERLYFTI